MTCLALNSDTIRKTSIVALGGQVFAGCTFNFDTVLTDVTTMTTTARVIENVGVSAVRFFLLGFLSVIRRISDFGVYSTSVLHTLSLTLGFWKLWDPFCWSRPIIRLSSTSCLALVQRSRKHSMSPCRLVRSWLLLAVSSPDATLVSHVRTP